MRYLWKEVSRPRSHREWFRGSICRFFHCRTGSRLVLATDKAECRRKCWALPCLHSLDGSPPNLLRVEQVRALLENTIIYKVIRVPILKMRPPLWQIMFIAFKSLWIMPFSWRCFNPRHIWQKMNQISFSSKYLLILRRKFKNSFKSPPLQYSYRNTNSNCDHYAITTLWTIPRQ